MPKKKSKGDSDFVFDPKNAQKAFEKRVKEAGLKIKTLLPSIGIHFMCSWYAAFRADGCPPENEADMLLYEWGTGADSKFKLSITRQFIREPKEDEDFSQLSLSFRFAPTNETTALGSGNMWLKSPQEILTGGTPVSIQCSAPFQAFGNQQPESVELSFVDGF